MPFYGDAQAELDAIGVRAQARAMAYSQTQKVTLDQINRANTIQRNYAWLPPGASYALARGGLDDETVHRVATSALQGMSTNTALGLNQPGDLVQADTEATRGKASWERWRAGQATPEDKQWINDNSKPGLTDTITQAATHNPVTRAGFTGSNPFASALRGTTRAVTAVLDAPRQQIQGSYRSFTYDMQQHGWQTALKNYAVTGGSLNPNVTLNQTDLGQTAGAVATGQPVDQGSGFFVGLDSGVAQARQREEARFGQTTYADGSVHNRSIGRDFAGHFFEPGTRGYQVLSGAGDAAVALAADLPGQHLVAGLKAGTEFKAIGEGIAYGDEVSRAAKIKDAMGLIANPGRRSTYSPQVLENWLGQNNGIKMAEGLAAGDAYDIFKIAPKMPGEMISALADAQTPDEVRQLMRAGLGQGSETVPTTALGRYGVTAKSYIPDHAQRLLNRLPSGSSWNADNPSEVLTQFDRQLDYMNTPVDEKRALFNKMAAIEHKPGDKVTWNLRKQVYMEGLNSWTDRAVAPVLKQVHGLPEGFDILKGNVNQGTYLNDVGETVALTAAQKASVQTARAKAKEIREIFNPLRANTYEDHVIFDMLKGGADSSIWDATINDAGEVIMGNSPQPQLLAEFHSQWMPTPDWKVAHKELSALGPLLSEKTGSLKGTAWATKVQENVWKPLVVLRPAGALRIIGETQAGLYAAGYQNIASHPLNILSMVIADTKLGERFGIKGLKTDVFGQELSDSQGLSEILNKHSVYSTKKAANYLPDEMVRIQPHEQGYHDAIGFQIGKMAHEPDDPLPRMIANAMANDVPLTKVEEQFWAMEDYRKQLQSIAPHRSIDEFGVAIGEGGAQFEPLMDRRFSDAYVRRTAERMREMTGTDPELLAQIVKPTLTTDELAGAVRKVDQNALPDLVAGPRRLTEAEKKSRQSVVDWGFKHLIRAPVHAFSEDPAVGQSYWKGMMERARFVDPKEAPALLASAEQAGLKNTDLRQLKYFAEQPIDNPMSLETLNDLAKSDSIKLMQKLFEDHVDKRRFIDAIKLVSPFAHVWAETLTRWSKFLAQDPTLLHNLEYGFHEATDPTTATSTPVGHFMGVPEGRAFLYPNEQGQEMFAYPLSAQAMKVFTAATPGPSVSAPLTGSLVGLSLGFDVIPGVGPIASLPIAKAIPNTPEWDSVNKIVFPYGEPKSLTNLKEQAPAWMRRAMNWDDQRTQGSTTMQTMVSLANTGKYDIHNQDPLVAEAESKRLESDARKSATWFTVFRGLVGAVAPSAPKPEWWLADKTGKRIMLQTLSNDFRDMYKADPQNAVLNFMDRYGENVMLAIQGKSISTALGGGMPPTKEAGQWERSKPGLANDLPLAYGFFAPRSDGKTDLDFPTYDRQFAKGERVSLTPDQFLQESNKRVAQTIYYSVRNTLPANLNVKQSAVMRTLREELSARYPGYSDKFGNEIVGVPAQATVSQTITQLTQAAGDQRLADNPATQTLRDYLKVRDAIRSQSAQQLNGPDSWLTTKSAAGARSILYGLGSKLAQENKAFSPMWESVLYREFQGQFETDQGIKG